MPAQNTLPPRRSYSAAMLPAHRCRLWPTSTTRSGLAHTNGNPRATPSSISGVVGLDRLVDVVNEAGADDGLRFRKRGIGPRQPGEQHAVPPGRADPMQALVSHLGDVDQGDVAGRHDRVPGIAPHAGFLEYALDARSRHGGVRDQHNRAAPRAKAGQRLAGLDIGVTTVVHDAPHVAEGGMVALEQRSGVGDDGWRHRVRFQGSGFRGQAPRGDVELQLVSRSTSVPEGETEPRPLKPGP